VVVVGGYPIFSDDYKLIIRFWNFEMNILDIE
jgi:hypothetical protein